jgi:hypothetical protein
LDGGEVIKRHIFRGLFFCDVLANMTSVASVNGVVHGIEVRGDNNETVRVGGAYIYKCDVLARNGVLHHVDRVIGMDYDTVSPTISPAPTITGEPTSSEEPTAAPVALFAEDPDSNAVPISLPPVTIPTKNDIITSDGAADSPGQDGSGVRSNSAISIMNLILSTVTLVWLSLSS